MDKYVQGKMIGKGSFGAVYLVRRKTDGQTLVLKKMRIGNVSDKERASFELEVKLLARLQHPGIVEYCDSFLDERQQFLNIIMGYCDGGDLSHLMKSKRGQKMTEKEALNLFVQMALALHYMHQQNVLHRDLKTQNIFIAGGNMKLGDFGISKVLDGTQDFAQTCIGTPYYMSPELFKNKPYNFKSDIWALGCVFYELLTLKHAFDANNLNGLAGKIIRGQYPAISPTYSGFTRNLLKKMLCTSPSARISMDEILKMPPIRKRIKYYVQSVLADQQSYAVRDVQNLNNQICQLGMKDMLTEIANPQGPKQSIKDNKKTIQTQILQQKELLLEEERNRKNMEIALMKLQREAQQRKDAFRLRKEQRHRHVYQHQQIVNDQQQRLNDAAKRKEKLCHDRQQEQERRHAALMRKRQIVQEKKERLEREKENEKLEAEERKAERNRRRREQVERETAERARVKKEQDRLKEAELERQRLLKAQQAEEVKLNEKYALEARLRAQNRELEYQSELKLKIEREREEVDHIREERRRLQDRLKRMDEEIEETVVSQPLKPLQEDIGSLNAKERVLANKRRLQEEKEAKRQDELKAIRVRNHHEGRTNRHNVQSHYRHSNALNLPSVRHHRNSSSSTFDVYDEYNNAAASTATSNRSSLPDIKNSSSGSSKNSSGSYTNSQGSSKRVRDRYRSFDMGNDAEAYFREQERGPYHNKSNHDDHKSSHDDDVNVDDDDNEDSNDEEIDNACQANEREIQEIESHLLKHTRHISRLRYSLKQTEIAMNESDEEDDDEDYYSDDEHHTHTDITANNNNNKRNSSLYDDDKENVPNGAPSYRMTGNLKTRIALLQKECKQMLGASLFQRVYDYLQSNGLSGSGDENEEHIVRSLSSMMNKNEIKHWKLVDQLIFMENN